MLTKIRVTNESLYLVQSDILIYYFYNDIIPLKGETGFLDWYLNGYISSLIIKKKITGAFKENTLILGNKIFKTRKLLLLGMGKSTNISSSKVVSTYSNLISIIKGLKTFNFTINTIHNNSDLEYKRIVNDTVDGIVKGLVKSNNEKTALSNIIINVHESSLERIPLLTKTLSYSVSRHKGKVDLIIDDVEIKKNHSL